MTKLQRLEYMLITIWTGIMIAIGYIAAPVLFKVLSDDRKLAGALAGEMFYLVTIVGLICGGVLLMLRYSDQSVAMFRQWRGMLLILMLGLVATSMFVLQPMIAETKALGLVEGSDAAKKFGMLHGVSALLYLVTVLSGVLLSFFGLRQPKKSEFI